MKYLIRAIKRRFSSELTGHLAARLGESENGVARALRATVPAVLQGLINKVEAGEGQLVYNLLQHARQKAGSSPKTVTEMLGMMGSVQEAGIGMAPADCLLLILFGGGGAQLKESIGAFAGVRPTSIGTLLGMVAVVVPMLLGQHTERYQLTTIGTEALLINLKGAVRAMMPPELPGLLAGAGARAAQGAALEPTLRRLGPQRMGQWVAAYMAAVNLPWRCALAFLMGCMLSLGYMQAQPLPRKTLVKRNDQVLAPNAVTTLVCYEMKALRL